MGSIGRGVGVIFVVCSKCGFVFYSYSIGGDDDNKAKFSGVPTPGKALSGYDGLVCPSCGRRVSLKPERIQVMNWRKFTELYDIVDRPLPRLRPSKTIVEEHVESMSGVERLVSDEPAGIG